MGVAEVARLGNERHGARHDLQECRPSRFDSGRAFSRGAGTRADGQHRQGAVPAHSGGGRGALRPTGPRPARSAAPFAAALPAAGKPEPHGRHPAQGLAHQLELERMDGSYPEPRRAFAEPRFHHQPPGFGARCGRGRQAIEVEEPRLSAGELDEAIWPPEGPPNAYVAVYAKCHTWGSANSSGSVGSMSSLA